MALGLCPSKRTDPPVKFGLGRMSRANAGAILRRRKRIGPVTERDLDVLLVSFEVHIGGAFGFRFAINSANGRHR